MNFYAKIGPGRRLPSSHPWFEYATWIDPKKKPPSLSGGGLTWTPQRDFLAFGEAFLRRGFLAFGAALRREGWVFRRTA